MSGAAGFGLGRAYFAAAALAGLMSLLNLVLIR